MDRVESSNVGWGKRGSSANAAHLGGCSLAKARGSFAGLLVKHLLIPALRMTYAGNDTLCFGIGRSRMHFSVYPSMMTLCRCGRSL